MVVLHFSSSSDGVLLLEKGGLIMFMLGFCMFIGVLLFICASVIVGGEGFIMPSLKDLCKSAGQKKL